MQTPRAAHAAMALFGDLPLPAEMSLREAGVRERQAASMDSQPAEKEEARRRRGVRAGIVVSSQRENQKGL